MTNQRHPLRLNTTATIITMIIGGCTLVGMVRTYYVSVTRRDDEIGAFQSTTDRQFKQVDAAFTRMSDTIDKFDHLLGQVMASEAGLHSDLVNLRERVDRMDRHP